MNIIICDDDPGYLKSLGDLINDWKEKNRRIDVSILSFLSTEDLFEKLESGLQGDAYFLDILFGAEMNGLELAQRIREYDEKSMVVFITNSEAYAKEGYLVHAFRYLSKPVSSYDLDACLDVAYRQHMLARNEYLILTSHCIKITLRFDQILYFEVMAPYIEIHWIIGKDDQMKRVRSALSLLKQKLPEELFVQCHRSYIVNVQSIQSIQRNALYLSNGIIIPVSRSCYRKVCDTFDRYYQGRI